MPGLFQANGVREAENAISYLGNALLGHFALKDVKEF